MDTIGHAHIQNFGKELNSKYLNNSIYFLILKRTQPTMFFLALLVFMSVDVTIFKVTLRGSAQIFVKKSTIDKNDMTQFVFIFPTQIKCEY